MLQKPFSKRAEYAEAATSRYPYTYARTAVMRAALIKRNDYAKLLKMSLSEVTSFLESTEYKKEIDELAVNYSGPELIELALNKNLSNTCRKLRRISSPGLRALIDTYLARKDVANIKTILRGKYTGAAEKEIVSMLQPYRLSQELLKGMLKKQSIEEVLKEITILPQSAWRPAYERFKETNMLLEIENALDQYYYGSVLSASAKLPSRGTLFKRFLQREIEVMNVMNVFRFRREGMERKDMQRYIFPIGGAADARIRKVAEAGNDELAAAFEATPYGAAAKHGIDEYIKKGTLIHLETGLYKYLLKQALMLAKRVPLVADAILGYMFAKEIEVKNLKLVVKAKQLNLTGEFIEEQLITL